MFLFRYSNTFHSLFCSVLIRILAASSFDDRKNVYLLAFLAKSLTRVHWLIEGRYPDSLVEDVFSAKNK